MATVAVALVTGNGAARFVAVSASGLPVLGSKRLTVLVEVLTCTSTSGSRMFTTSVDTSLARKVSLLIAASVRVTISPFVPPVAEGRIMM